MPDARPSHKAIDLDKRIIFALDVASPDEAKEWVLKLEEHIKFFKVGLQLFLAGWFHVIDWIVKRNLEVMVDLKFFDVPQTVASAVEQLKDRGISFTTAHGNDEVIRAAVRAKHDVKLLAVTVLTSLDEADIRDLGFDCSVERLVLSRARRSLQLGCDGLVASGLEALALRQELGESFLVVVPGVRPVANREDDQKRVVDVRKAFSNGADYVVIGRPIRQASDPATLIREMQGQIESTLASRRA